MVAAFGVLVASWPLPSDAADPPEYGRTRLGPLYLTLRATLSAGIDDNVYNSATAVVSDESVTLVPGIEVVLPLTRRARIKSSGGLAPHFFATEKAERHTDRFGSVGAELDLGPFSAAASRGAGRFRERFSLEIDERLSRDETVTALGGAFRVRRISVGASRRVTKLAFARGRDGTLFDVTLDRNSTTDRFQVTLPITRQTALVPAADLVEDRFLHPASGLLPTVRSQRYGLAFEFGKLAFISGRVAGGIHRFGAGQGVAPYSGPFVEVNAGMPFLLGTRLILDGKRDVTYAAAAAADPSSRNTAVSSVYRGELQFGLPWQMHGRAFTSYSGFDYLLPTVVEGSPMRREDSGWQYGGALLRRLGDYLSLGVTAQRVGRGSVVIGRSYRGWSYALAGEFRY